jgi:hypothetical protein
MDNVFAQEENMLIPIFNVFHVSITAQYVEEKTIVLFVMLVISFKIENVLLDATSVTTFQELYVKNVKMDVLTVKEPELVLFVKLVDLPTTDYAMSIAQPDLLPKLQI